MEIGSYNGHTRVIQGHTNFSKKNLRRWSNFSYKKKIRIAEIRIASSPTYAMRPLAILFFCTTNRPRVPICLDPGSPAHSANHARNADATIISPYDITIIQIECPHKVIHPPGSYTFIAKTNSVFVCYEKRLGRKRDPSIPKTFQIIKGK